MNKTFAPFLLFLALLLAACGSPTDKVESPAVEEAPTGDSAQVEGQHGDTAQESHATEGAEGKTEIELVATDLAFDPAELRVVAGRPVGLHFVNEGALEHDFTIDQIDMENLEHRENVPHDAHAPSDADLHLHLEPGAEGVLLFTPLTPGNYIFYCSVPGHREAGMIGTFIVAESL